MPDSVVIDVVLRQLRRVRWRHNLHALQRMAYGSVAVGALLGAAVVLLALRGTPPVFAAGTVLAALVLCGTAIGLARVASRDWLRRASAPARVDRTMRLDGRLLTLVDVPPDADAAFVAVLERQTNERLPSWTPARVVPRVVPRAMLTAALAALVVLATTVAFAPRLRRATPRVVVGDRPMDWKPGNGGDGDTAETQLLAPGVEHASDENAAAGDTRDGEDGDADPSALQAWLQHELLGDTGPSWDGGDATVASSSRRPTTARTQANDGGPSASSDEPPPSTERAAAGDAARDAHPAHGDAAEGSGDAPGAGNGTDPRLFGAIAPDGATANDRFELAIAARVRTRQGGPGAPQGDAPEVEPDRHPTLGSGGRTDDPVHRMPVPVAWETVVRRLYTRRAGGPEAVP